jgi:hypothetical protein
MKKSAKISLRYFDLPNFLIRRIFFSFRQNRKAPKPVFAHCKPFESWLSFDIGFLTFFDNDVKTKNPANTDFCRVFRALERFE